MPRAYMSKLLLLIVIALTAHSTLAEELKSKISDYFVNLKSSDFLPWLREEFQELQQDADKWKHTYRNNLEALRAVAPFVNSTQGNFQQNFEGKWAAVDSKDPRLIEEAFEKSEGWAKLTFIVESFDMKNINQTQIDQIREHLGNDAVENLLMQGQNQTQSLQDLDLSYSDLIINEKSLNATNSTLVEVIEEEEEDIVVQSDELNKNTVVSKIYVIVQLFDQMYIDDSIEISFIKYIEGYTDQEGNFIDTEKRRLQFDTQNLTITSKDLQEPTKTRNCELSAQLSVIEIDPLNITDNMTDPSGKSIKERIKDQEYIDSSDHNLNTIRKLFLIDLEIESAWEQNSTALDQDAVVNLTSENPVQESDVNSTDDLVTYDDSGTCFPKKIIAQFTNTKSTGWFDRFRSYSNAYLIVSIMAVCASSFQKHELHRTLVNEPERINSLSMMPLIIITAWSLASLFFHLILAVGLMRSEILSMIIHLFILIFVFSNNYRLTLLALKNKISMRHKRAYIYTIYLLGIIFLVWGRQLVLNDAWMFILFGPIWIPQIINNLLARRVMKPEYHYNQSFLILQSIHFLFIPAYARGFSENFYFLKPHDSTVKSNLILVSVSVIVLRLMAITYEGILARLSSRRRCNLCRLVPQRLRRAIRRYLIARIQRNHVRKQGLDKKDTYLYWKPFSNLYKEKQLDDKSKQPSSDQENPDKIALDTPSSTPQALQEKQEPAKENIATDQVIQKQSDFTQLTYLSNNNNPDSPKENKLDKPLDGDSSGSPEATTENNNSFECVICLCSLRYEPVDLNIDGTYKDPNALKKCKGYLETPCKHYYHRSCMVRWFEAKQECPTCRTKLPPIQPYDGQFDSDDEEQNQQPQRQQEQPSS